MGDYIAKYQPGQDVTYTAAAAITGGQVVYLSAAGQVTATSAAHANVLGVAENDAATGAKVAITRGGVQRLTASAAVSVGAYVKSATAGKVATATIGTDPQSQVLGFALTAAAADGDVIDVQWEK